MNGSTKSNLVEGLNWKNGYFYEHVLAAAENIEVVVYTALSDIIIPDDWKKIVKAMIGGSAKKISEGAKKFMDA